MDVSSFSAAKRNPWCSMKKKTLLLLIRTQLIQLRKWFALHFFLHQEQFKELLSKTDCHRTKHADYTAFKFHGRAGKLQAGGTSININNTVLKKHSINKKRNVSALQEMSPASFFFNNMPSWKKARSTTRTRYNLYPTEHFLILEPQNPSVD